ncbi:hypothetical protein RQP46_001098 [Phenoliferia psychrophenolica]
MLPVIDLDVFLADSASSAAKLEADKCVIGMIDFGAVLVKNSRASEEVNSRFLDTLEDYFFQPAEVIAQDLRPEVFFQVGSTMENTEKPKCHSDAHCQDVIAALDPAERPLDLEGGKADPKARFFRRLGKTPPQTAFPALAMPNVVPGAFSGIWDDVWDSNGAQLQSAVATVVEMLEIGFGIAAGAIQAAGEYGPHLLAPTATNLVKYGTVGEIFAGFHVDIGFMSCHGRSRYPGLNIWARNTGKRMAVKLPPGHFLVQAGKQLEHLTGGIILAGYHEVVCNDATIAAIEARKADLATAARPLIRISSTSFYQLGSDCKSIS